MNDLLVALFAFVLGGQLIATYILVVHDQQTIETLKRYHARLKKLEGRD